tara:strand:+ start:517 stop:1332 length:816 start_codon:yes stop_codon:yes gene_type:complete
MKLIMESWKKFLNESTTGMINTVRGKEDVEIAILRKKPVETENWFVWKSGKYVYVTHKATGNKIDSHLWQPKYGKTVGAAKKLINDLEKNLNLPDIASPDGLSMESQKALLDFLRGDVLNEYVSKKTSQNFEKFATAVGAVSSSMADDAAQSEKFQELIKSFEDAGLEDFLEKIPDVDELLQSLDDPKGSGEFIKGLQDLDLSPQEIGEKIEQIQTLRDEFDEYKEEQGEAQEERDEKQAEVDQEQDKAMKDASREQADADNAAQAQQAEI